MPFFVATYEYTDDTAGRDAVRPSHRAFLGGLVPALVVSGPTDANSAVLVLEAGSADEVATMLDEDPFKAAGFIAHRSIAGWTPVMGKLVEAGVLP